MHIVFILLFEHENILLTDRTLAKANKLVAVLII